MNTSNYNNGIDNTCQMQGIITSTTGPVPSTAPQKSIFSSLMTQLPAANKDTQMKDLVISRPSSPTTSRNHGSSIRRRGSLMKRPAPRDWASSFNLEGMAASFTAGPGADQAMQDEEHAFRHVKAYADANAEQNRTMTAFSKIQIRDHQDQIGKGSTKEKQPNPFFQQALDHDQAIQEFQTCLVSCQGHSQKWASVWAPSHFVEYARSTKGKTRLILFTQSIGFMSDFLIEGRNRKGWSEESLNMTMLRKMDDRISENLSAVEKLVDLGTEGSLLKGALRPLRRMSVRVREMRETAVRLEAWRDEQLGFELATEFERQNAEYESSKP